MIQHPRYLANVLKKLEYSMKRSPMEANPSTAHMFIVNPVRGKEEFPNFSKDISYKLSIFEGISEFSSGSLLSLPSGAHAVTLSGFAGGESLPLPAHRRLEAMEADQHALG